MFSIRYARLRLFAATLHLLKRQLSPMQNVGRYCGVIFCLLEKSSSISSVNQGGFGFFWFFFLEPDKLLSLETVTLLSQCLVTGLQKMQLIKPAYLFEHAWKTLVKQSVEFTFASSDIIRMKGARRLLSLI